jgi:hypothetical protein
MAMPLVNARTIIFHAFLKNPSSQLPFCLITHPKAVTIGISMGQAAAQTLK